MINCKFIKTLVVGAALTCLFSVSALATSDGAGNVNANNVNLRSDTGTNSSIIKTVAKDSQLVVLSRENNEWYKVWTGGSEGYMSAGYINYSETLDASFGKGTINGSNVRMRAGAGTDTNILGKYNTGDVMNVSGVSGNWYKVSVSGANGFVHSDYLTLENQTATSTQTATGNAIVDSASKYMGVPYVWAGTSPKGFDCSGFVFYVFQENGYKTNRTAAALYKDGSAVDRSQLQAGDIICFYNGGYSYIGHVGIYIGNNQFIHASSGGGKVVIDSLSTAYYNNHYYGARRIAG